jgi:next-to-BRCA1 protein 1
MIERYSDSAAAFVLLDSSNMAVYKQLYRAAKAKSKLKLRVTILEQEPKAVPKPVSVQDVPETPANAVKPEPETTSSQTSLPLRTSSAFSKTYDPFLLNKAAKYLTENDDARQDFESRLSCLVSRGNTHSANVQRSVQSEVCRLVFFLFDKQVERC